MVGEEGVDLGGRLAEVDRQYVRCPVCSHSATVSMYIYRISDDDIIGIMTLKCSYCGSMFRDVIPLSEVDSEVCLEVFIEKDIDLNTILYTPSSVDVEIPQLNITLEVKQLRIGSIITVDAVIQYIADSLDSICVGEATCREISGRLRSLMRGRIEEPITLRIRSAYSPLRVVKSYRDGNYSYC